MELKLIFALLKNLLKKNICEKNLIKLARIAMATARKVFRKGEKKGTTKVTRVITIPKSGGMIPLISIFAGLSKLSEYRE